MSRKQHPDSSSAGCDGCGLPNRRAFLRDAAALAAGALLAIGAAPERAHALGWTLGRALGARGNERTYPLPTADGVTIDKDNAVIVARFQGKVYALSLTCPHQNTALRWLPDDGRFQCPKHKSKYQPDGLFMSGRATRSMDRFAVKRAGETLLVDLDSLYRQDKQKSEWEAAAVAV